MTALLSSSIQRGVLTKLTSGAEISKIYSSAFNKSQDIWPNVTLTGFNEIMQSEITLSQSRAVSFNPIVSLASKKAFDRYAIDAEYLNRGYDSKLVDWPISKGIYSKNANGMKITASGMNTSAYPAVLVPVWQIYPMAGNMKAVMYDLHSEAYRMQALDHVMATGEQVMTDVLQLVQDSAVSRPSTILFTPVYTAAGDIIGTTSVVFSWDDVIREILPSYVSGIVLVMQTSSTTFTYTVQSGYVLLTGPGDHHDSAYNAYCKQASASSVHVLSSTSTVSYSFSIYPSRTYEHSFLSDQPRDSAVLVVLVIFVTSLVFLVYDYLVSARQATLTAVARSASSIVNALYPKFVRGRLFTPHQEGEDHNAQNDTNTSIAQSSALRLRKFVVSSLNEATEVKTGLRCRSRTSSTSSTKFEVDYGLHTVVNANPNPIAESFDCVTVLFADLAGFTNWSSHRPPHEVFDLLETLYADFDRSARDRGVFKVETIGDCYMAVTGVPDQLNDHADKMAKFSLDLIAGLQRIKCSKAYLTGVNDLEIRVGMHSGPCTAGVLRGDKPRFQLFGDTVNTASRMESNGVPGRIQISEETFFQLQLFMGSSDSPYAATQRPEKVQAKGKGYLTTYWLFGKAAAAAFEQANTHDVGVDLDHIHDLEDIDIAVDTMKSTQVSEFDSIV